MRVSSVADIGEGGKGGNAADDGGDGSGERTLSPSDSFNTDARIVKFSGADCVMPDPFEDNSTSFASVVTCIAGAGVLKEGSGQTAYDGGGEPSDSSD